MTLADALCFVPSEAEAVRLESAWNRFSHADLAAMSVAELRRELARVNQRLIFEDNPTETVEAWLLDRRRWIIATLEHLHAAAGSRS